MADLLDIIPATAVEAVRLSDGQRIVVRGIRGPDIAVIVSRFPKVIAAAVAGGDNLGFIISLGMAAGPIIAAGCRQLGDEKAEAVANELLLEDQIMLVNAIMGLTFPKGLAAFMELVANLMGGAAGEKQKTVYRLKKSPSTSPPLSGADSRPIMQ